MKRFSVWVLFGSLATVSAPAYATLTPIDLSAEVNTHVLIKPQTFPIGLSTGNEGLNVPFLTSAAPGTTNLLGTWISAPNGPGSTSVTVPLTPLNIIGQASFYALLNNYYGTAGANEYNVTIRATNGDSAVFQSVGGVDTRDYNSAQFSNTIAASTTNWYDNGQGQRLDMRLFNLPSSFATEQLASFNVTQVNSRDSALLSGLTFSSAPASFTDPAGTSVPEPKSIVLLGSAILAAGFVRRRARRLRGGGGDGRAAAPLTD